MRRSKDNWQSLGQLFSGNIKLSLLHANSLTQTEWKWVVEFAFREHVAPELYVRLRQLSVEEKLPKDWLEALRASYQLNELIHSQYCEVFRDILVACDAIGIQPILLKGGIDVVSSEDRINSSRMISDLDILVGHDEAEKLQRDLIKLGFREDVQFKKTARDASQHHHLCPLWHHKYNLYAEIHCSLEATNQFDNLNKRIFLDLVKRDIDGLIYKVPSTMFRLFHNVVHQVNDENNGNGRSFRQLLDLYRLTNELNRPSLNTLISAEFGAGLASELKNLQYFVSHVFDAVPPDSEKQPRSFFRMHLFWLSKDYTILRFIAFWGRKLSHAGKHKNILQKISNPVFYKKAIADCLSFIKK